jgi:hypothetical protein
MLAVDERVREADMANVHIEARPKRRSWSNTRLISGYSNGPGQLGDFGRERSRQ